MNSNIAISKERDSNLELYRILVMLLIVAHHYVVNSGLMPLLENRLQRMYTVNVYCRYVGQDWY